MIQWGRRNWWGLQEVEVEFKPWWNTDVYFNHWKKNLSSQNTCCMLKKNGRRLEWKWSSLGWKSRNPGVSVSLCDSDLIVNGNFYQSFNSVEIWGCMQTQIMFSLDFCYLCCGDFLSGEYWLANGMIKFDEPPVVCWWVYSSTVRGSNWEM